ncbi:hypothetical protein [Glaciecola sp. 1036]|uniref:hypothetical protein n=1 Tax=Alteromonadaceae TaxID=72275 RepID=UPI003D050037
MKAITTVLLVTAMVATFRRAGIGFSDTGTVIPKECLDEEQLDAIHKEKRLSVREISVDDIPEGADKTIFDQFVRQSPQGKEEDEDQKAPNAKAKSSANVEKAKAGAKS